MFVIPVRTLSREFRLRTDCRQAARALAFVKVRPEIAGATLQSSNLDVERVGGFYRIAPADGAPVEGSARYLVDVVTRLTLRHLASELPDAPLVRAASVHIGGKTFLLVGAKGAGKTTLALHLMAQGFAVEGDSYVAVREADVITFPQPLRVRPGSLDLVPSLAGRIRRAPYVIETDGSRVYAVGAGIGGETWRIAPSRAPQLMFFAANHGGRTVAKPISIDLAFSHLMAHSILPSARAAGAARLRRVAREARAWEMSVGDLAGAVRHLTAFAEHCYDF